MVELLRVHTKSAIFSPQEIRPAKKVLADHGCNKIHYSLLIRFKMAGCFLGGEWQWGVPLRSCQVRIILVKLYIYTPGSSRYVKFLPFGRFFG